VRVEAFFDDRERLEAALRLDVTRFFCVVAGLLLAAADFVEAGFLVVTAFLLEAADFLVVAFFCGGAAGTAGHARIKSIANEKRRATRYPLRSTP
jgi:hypothetical protein